MTAKIFLIRTALARCYTHIGAKFEKTRDAKVSFFIQAKYQPRKDRCSAMDFVFGDNSFAVYDYSSDPREHPVLISTYSSLREFLRSRLHSYIDSQITPSLAYIEHQSLLAGKGRLTPDQFMKAREKVYRMTARDKQRVDHYINGFSIGVLSWLVRHT